VTTTTDSAATSDSTSRQSHSIPRQPNRPSDASVHDVETTHSSGDVVVDATAGATTIQNKANDSIRKVISSISRLVGRVFNGPSDTGSSTDAAAVTSHDGGVVTAPMGQETACGTDGAGGTDASTDSPTAHTHVVGPDVASDGTAAGPPADDPVVATPSVGLTTAGVASDDHVACAAIIGGSPIADKARADGCDDDAALTGSQSFFVHPSAKRNSDGKTPTAVVATSQPAGHLHAESVGSSGTDNAVDADGVVASGPRVAALPQQRAAVLTGPRQHAGSIVGATVGTPQPPIVPTARVSAERVVTPIGGDIVSATDGGVAPTSVPTTNDTDAPGCSDSTTTPTTGAGAPVPIVTAVSSLAGAITRMTRTTITRTADAQPTDTTVTTTSSTDTDITTGAATTTGHTAASGANTRTSEQQHANRGTGPLMAPDATTDSGLLAASKRYDAERNGDANATCGVCLWTACASPFELCERLGGSACVTTTPTLTTRPRRWDRPFSPTTCAVLFRRPAAPTNRTPPVTTTPTVTAVTKPTAPKQRPVTVAVDTKASIYSQLSSKIKVGTPRNLHTRTHARTHTNHICMRQQFTL
jgi:hypothetical protein